MDTFAGLLFLLLTLGFSGAVCPDGWIRHGQMCYHFSHEKERWTGAKVMCETMKSQLVEIETADENHALAQQAQLNKKIYWTALTDVIEEDTWVWMSSLTPATYLSWYSGEPNGREGENCIVLDTDGRWHDYPCSSEQYYICEKTDAVEIIGKR